jgi:hypothetical protein
MSITRFLEASVLMAHALEAAKPIIESVAKNSRNPTAKKNAVICIQQIEAALRADRENTIKNDYN